MASAIPGQPSIQLVTVNRESGFLAIVVGWDGMSQLLRPFPWWLPIQEFQNVGNISSFPIMIFEAAIRPSYCS